ncbi:MAG: chorismate synthase [Candidatus Anstonellales archaeon]
MSFKTPYSFGDTFTIRVFGSSHGSCVGVEINGCPKGISVTKKDVQLQLDRRKPAQSIFTTQRRESDVVEIKSGIIRGKTTGQRILMQIKNQDVRPSDYSQFEQMPRPGHADYPALIKYGKLESGSGIFSGRMTASFVMAGSVAKQLLKKDGILTMAFMRSIGKVRLARDPSDKEVLFNTYKSQVRCPDTSTSKRMEEEVKRAMLDNDSVGGVVECRIVGMPPGLGEPMFGSIESKISSAIFAIPAVKGIEFGKGFEASKMRGSKHNDQYTISGKKIVTKTNNAGGILGGLSTGMPITFRVAFKPTSSIYSPQKTIDLKEMKETTLRIIGRHDPCIAIRAVAVVENVAAICIADILLSEKRNKRPII